MKKLYVTYGYGSNLANNYSVVEGDPDDIGKKIWEVTGGMYAFVYTEDEFAGQAENYGLTEVPLQPQVTRK